MSIFISRNVGGHFSGLTVGPPEGKKEATQLTGNCQSCNVPAGQGHGVRLRDVTYELWTERSYHNKGAIQAGQIGYRMALCSNCAETIMGRISVEDAACGQEDDCDK